MKNVPVCTFKTSPFVPAPRAHMFQHVCAWCRYTRGRFERTHGDVLSGHTEFRSVSHTNTHTHINTHNTTHHDTTHHDHTTSRPQHHTEKDRDRERRQGQREKRRRKRREREEKTEEERQDKRREDKRRQKREVRRFFFQCGGAWPFFFVGVVICLVKPVCARFLSLLNSIKYDSF